jgi:anthranilate phosphoribosyltransferase
LLGVARPEIAGKMAAALQQLGAKHVLVVHGCDGADELSISGPSVVHELVEGTIREYTMKPEDAGLSPSPSAAIRGGTPEQNAAVLKSVLMGERGALRDVVVLNAAAALIAADLAPDLEEGAALAQEAIDSGAAARKLEEWINCTTSFS